MDVETVTNSIKQLVIGSSKFMQEAHTLEQAEERILHLEENDDQFHKYDMVKILKTQIEDAIGPIVDEEIERYSESGHDHMSDQDTLVARVTEKVIRSHEFADLKATLTKNVQEAVDKLVENFEEEFRDVGSEESPPGTPVQRDPYAFSDEESTLSGSYNQGAFMFVTHEQLRKNLEHLDKRNNAQTRRAALNNLLHLSMNDALTNDENYQREWGHLERGIIDALGEYEDEVLPKLALKFISHGFASSHANSRELYGTLTAFLYEYFTKDAVPKVKNGLDGKQLEIANLLCAFRLLNDYQRHIPNYWIRYPTRFLDEVLHNTLKLVSVGNHMSIGASQSLTPLHMIALLDPRADWFIKWTHGCFSRQPLVNLLVHRRGLLENSVRCILEFVASRKVPFDLVSEASDSFQSQRGSTGTRGQRFTYTGDELEYIYFVHAMHVVGRLLLYSQSADLFPVNIHGYGEPISITRLICSICELITNLGGHGSSMRNLTAVYEPSVLAAELLKKLCCSESAYQMCLCKDEVTNTLTVPIIQWLDGTCSDGQVSEATFQNVAEILSMMASRTEGRRHLLYGEYGEILSRSRSSTAHAVAEFTKRMLNNNSVVEGNGKVVTGAFLFLCRQLYNNCEGLQALYTYDIHSLISEAWKKSTRANDGLRGGDHRRDTDSGSVWSLQLNGNLLSFACTPKGVLLMQQSGAMHACVSHMFARHQGKQQVSQLEKYGYGTMLTQIAGTPCGMQALDKIGFIRMLCLEAWESVEPGEEREVPFQPKSWPVEAIDKISLKPLVNLLHALSSFTSVFEILGGEKMPSKGEYSFRDKPSTVLDILSRVSLINVTTDDSKLHFLFNYEQSHVFGLRLLSSLISCLDTQLLLDSQFNVVETLMVSQTAEHTCKDGQIIIDQLTIERSYVLAKVLVMGGPSERVLPSRTLSQGVTISHPIIHCLPLPKEYLPNLAGKSSIKQETELSRFLNDSKQTSLDQPWLEKCRKCFCGLMMSKPDQAKGNVLQDMLEKAVKSLSKTQEVIFQTSTASDVDSGAKSFKLTNLQELGVKKAVQYGVHLKLLTSTHEAQDNLTKLLRQCGYFLKQQHRQVNNNMRSLGHNYVGFDWFVATIFIMMKGNRDRSWKFLQKFSSLAVSGYLWAPRLHRSIHLPAAIAGSGISPILYSACHNVELILQLELPLVHSAFKMSGFTPSQICQLWTRQCFWNYLDWLDICHYISVCTLLGCDYQVYMCVAVLRHLQHDILLHQQQQDLVIVLREGPIQGFKVGNHLEYMQQLQKKYRKTVLSDMMYLSKP